MAERCIFWLCDKRCEMLVLLTIVHYFHRKIHAGNYIIHHHVPRYALFSIAHLSSDHTSLSSFMLTLTFFARQSWPRCSNVPTSVTSVSAAFLTWVLACYNVNDACKFHLVPASNSVRSPKFISTK